MCLITLLAVSLFVSLGLWQFERASFKESIELKYQARLDAGYVLFETVDDWTAIEYQKVELRGRYLEGNTLLLDNQIENGRAGYHVITPFELTSGDLVLINRGWVAAGNSRQVLPGILPVANTNLARGIVTIPGNDVFRLGDVLIGEQWPQLIPFVDISAMQSAFDNQLLPVLIWLGAEQEGVYQRNWQPVWLKPEKSRAYAWQWIAFAVIALLLFFILNLRKLDD